MTRPVHGLYHGRGWVVDVGDDADSQAALVASIHEAMHDRLQMTTIFGVVVDLLTDLGARRRDEATTAQAMTLQRASTQVHEQFATWMSAVPAGWGRSELDRWFPIYTRHLSRSSARVADLAGRYLAMHAIQGAARACMQPARLADLVSRMPVQEIRPNLIGRHERPDWRLARLDAALRRTGWGPIADWPGEANSLDPERFAADNDPEWDELNRAAYEWCRTLLESEDCATLPYDGHLRHARAQRAMTGSSAKEKQIPPSSVVALHSVESERMILRPPIRARVLAPTTDPAELTAGPRRNRHLFLAIRPRHRLMEQYDLHGHPLPDHPHVAVLRCQTDDGSVDLLDVTQAAPSTFTGRAPLIANVSMTSLAAAGTLPRWAWALAPGRSTVLLDQRPSVNLPAWLAEERSLRYAFFGAESRSGWVTVFAFRIESAGGQRSRVYLSPVPKLYAAGLRLALAESPSLDQRTREDLALADEPDVRATVAHILLEERIFDFRAGDHGV